MSSNSWRFLATAFLLGATLLFATLSNQRRPESLATPLSSIPKEIDGWTGIDAPPLDSGVVDTLRPTSYLDRVYRRGSQQVSLFISYYAEQRAGESMHSPKNCLPGSGWEIWNYSSARVPFHGRSVAINRYSIQSRGTRLVVLYWYQSKERIVASEYLGKVLLIRDALVRGATAGSIVKLTVSDEPQAVEAGIAFAASIIPQMENCLGR